MFDPDTFMNTSVEGASSTQIIPIPEGEYPAHITKIAAKAAGEYSILNVFWSIDDPAAAEAVGRAPNTRQSIFLDFDENGALSMDEGKNVSLGRLREALDQNNPNEEWNPNMLLGGQAIVRVTHRAGDDGEMYDQVDRTAAIV